MTTEKIARTTGFFDQKKKRKEKTAEIENNARIINQMFVYIIPLKINF